jgi:hypothetical protein
MSIMKRKVGREGNTSKGGEGRDGEDTGEEGEESGDKGGEESVRVSDTGLKGGGGEYEGPREENHGKEEKRDPPQ